MEKQIKKTVDEELAGLGLQTKADMESIITKLEAKVLNCIQAEMAKTSKPLDIETRVQALGKRIEAYDAHFTNLEQKLDDAEQYSCCSQARNYRRGSLGSGPLPFSLKSMKVPFFLDSLELFIGFIGIF